ncbi:MAG: Inositol 2-dehydrogenase/D-chiro-inositol 3-dehydrogenase [Phycisphaerae bacterium]|nr:Inositol 2-dehydrogenase/D-chiro-inositol 3-dehydrogenase [Phycisphaerae bacterium]
MNDTKLGRRVGLVGCGNISSAYLRNARRLGRFEIVACADLIAERAAGRAAEYSTRAAASVDALLADPAIDVVLNLTIPRAHASVALAALEAGKSVYNEKPLALTRADGCRLLDEAQRRGLRVGCAPDTFLGAGLQTCRRLIDQGAIGEPVAATAFMTCHGHENWHPDPAFYYQPGGGPMFDMGPYYLTALVHLLGPMRRVSAAARACDAERVITSQPKHGQRIRVETPTHVTGVLEFHRGALATVVTSFDVWHARLPIIEIYGREGSLAVPDPNTFGGPLLLRGSTETAWREVPLAFPHAEESRGLGLADMIDATSAGHGHRASGTLAFHVLDAMHAFLESGQTGQRVELISSAEQPAPLPAA